MLPALAKALVVSTTTCWSAARSAGWWCQGRARGAPVKGGPALIAALAPVEIVMSLGSSSRVPVRQIGAGCRRCRRTPASACRRPRPGHRRGRGTSAGRDRAGEAGRAVGPDVTLPPWPTSRASALSEGPGAACVVRGLTRAGFAPWYRRRPGSRATAAPDASTPGVVHLVSRPEAHAAAATAAAGRVDRAGDVEAAGAGIDRHLAARVAAGGDAAGRRHVTAVLPLRRSRRRPISDAIGAEAFRPGRRAAWMPIRRRRR